MFQLILVSGNWAHAWDPMLPENQMTQAKTSTLPNRCHSIQYKSKLGDRPRKLLVQSNAPANTVSFITLWRESGEAKAFEMFTLLAQGLYLMNPLTVCSALTVER